MRILDIFKTKKIEKEKVEISLDNNLNNLNNINKLEGWLDKKEQETEEKEKKLSALIFERQLQLISELEENLRKLGKLDIDKRREEEKIKLIVKKNQELFIGHVNQLILEFKKIEKQDKIKGYIEKINSTITLFEKSSFSSFQKATILIGKEIRDIKDSIARFFNYLNKILKENQEIFDNLENIKKLKENLSELNKNNNFKKELTIEITNKTKAIEKIKSLIENNKRNLQEAKGSKEYKDKLELEKKFSELESELRRKVFNLKEDINIKSLLKHFHQDKKKSNFIKKYDENFLSALLEDKETKIFQFANEIGKSIDIEKIEEIKTLSLEIEIRNKKLPIDEKIEQIINFIKNRQQEIENLQKEIEKEKTKTEKLDEKSSEILNNLKNNIKDFEIEIS